MQIYLFLREQIIFYIRYNEESKEIIIRLVDMCL